MILGQALPSRLSLALAMRQPCGEHGGYEGGAARPCCARPRGASEGRGQFALAAAISAIQSLTTSTASSNESVTPPSAAVFA